MDIITDNEKMGDGMNEKEVGQIRELLNMTLDEIFEKNNSILYCMGGFHRLVRITYEHLDLPEYIQQVIGDYEVLDMEAGEFEAIAEYWYGEYSDDPKVTEEIARDAIKGLFGRIPSGYVHVKDEVEHLYPIDFYTITYEGQTLQQLCFIMSLRMPEWMETECEVWE